MFLLIFSQFSFFFFDWFDLEVLNVGCNCGEGLLILQRVGTGAKTLQGTCVLFLSTLCSAQYQKINKKINKINFVNASN